MSPDIETIRDHYRNAQPVFEELATVGEYPTIGLNDFVGWYVRRDHDDFDAIESGYPRRGRVARLDRDFAEIVGRLDRTLYAVTTYKDPAAFQRWEPCRYDDEEGRTVWRDGPPTPDYRDLRAVPAWGDIDLADDVKAERGNLNDEVREVVEETLDAYIDEYAELYGSRDAVYALDSVGGAYVFGAPEATLPIAEHFEDDHDTLDRVFDAFLDRSNEWLREAERRVNDRVDGAADVTDPDWVNNKNRQYKPPLSIHADHDAVVTPLDVDDLEYEVTRFDEVDDAVVDEALSWAASFTVLDHEDCVSTLVANLWPEVFEEHGDWRSTLDAWVEVEREREREAEQQRERALRRRQERLDELGDALEGLPVTPFKRDVYEAVESVDVTEIAEYHASDDYDTDPAQPRAQFDPCWRHSESGQSCFVDEQDNTFGDSKVNAGGGPAKLMALTTGIIHDARQELDGERYWEAVDALREAGYEIPVWIPEAGSESVDGETYEQMPFWAVKKGAVALGVCPDDAFVEQEGDDGTYEGFPGYQTYNEALAAIEDAGLEHGRRHVTPENAGSEQANENVGSNSTAIEDIEKIHLLEQNRLLKERVARLEETIEQLKK